ncbi:14502_t:CDS:10 [Entrophospora sp. SA101]|nr:14502_t:CDS:10 [Entrophospora sp. SA101]
MSLKLSLSRTLVRKSVFRPRQQQQQYITKMVNRNFSNTNSISNTSPYPVDNSVGPMLRYEKSLPRLPVPKLSDTLDKYLKSVRPLVNDEEFAKTQAAIEEFKKPGGIGEELQKRLLTKANDPNVINWLEDWWNEIAYFGYRDPVVVYVSYFFSYKDDKLRKNPATRASWIAKSALEFKRLVVTQQLEPDYAKTTPLSMDSFKWMFNACRYPAKPSDYELTFDPTTNNHMIYSLAGVTKDPAIGSLTTENRDVWTDFRNLLLKANPKHEEMLKKIESSAFVLCLDDTKPVTLEEISHSCWVGDGRNRFFDKSLQFIIFDNGRAGFNGEHSSMDGMPTSRLNDFVCDVIAKNKLDAGPSTIRSDLPIPEQLHFTFNNQILDAIQKAEKDFDELVAKHDLRVWSYDGYGKNTIKSFGFSPDAYMQMILQLAYYKMYGINRATYESAQTRKYAHGRTEVCRSVSVDSVNWVKAMEDPKLPVKKAIGSHVKYMSDAVNGYGCDRHLLDGESKPSIFSDPAYSRSSHWNLSTSQLSSNHFIGYGWGEVVPDGYGFAYMIKDNSLHVNIVSMHLNNERMHYYITEAANEMREVFELSQLKQGQLKSKL